MKINSPYLLFSLAVVLLLTSCQSSNSAGMKERLIETNWEYAQVNGEYSGHASIPGTIHTDLLNNRQIEDPFYRTNEKQLQWIDKEDWEYTTTFHISKDEYVMENIKLYFEGLDTYADVFINDSIVLKADNMFREWEIDVKPFVSIGNNILTVYLHSPIKKGLKLHAASAYPYPAGNDQSENGGLGDKKVSVFTRKAGYHYGWDWGPRFVTSGIWRPVKLKMWNDLRIKNAFIKQPSVNVEIANLEAELNVEANKDLIVNIRVLNKIDKRTLASKEVSLKKGDNIVSLPFEITKPRLWWSAGLGDPNLYDFEIQVAKDADIIASKKITTGLRSLKLIREEDEYGESFFFELNGVKVFSKGANYIPNDSFLPRVTKTQYENVIANALNANMNMLRVWGGGIYENDYFYELCDKNGIMVWQDFMFACSMYPGNEEFLENVKQEAIDNVIRLRNHPSIALWCGNNEINAAWSFYSEGGWGWKERYTPEQREEMNEAYLSIFHDILPNVISVYTDGDDYWPSSPQAGSEPEKRAGYNTTSGDMHYWGVWHGKHPFEDFEKYKARFMSEYGFQSFPDFETVKKYTRNEDYDIESEVMAAHQRSGIGNLRIKDYMSWNYKIPEDFEGFLYVSQLLQARGIKMAIEAHRRAMPYCMGTLYWQLNDCWPVASWSSTDYYQNWKALHYAVKRAYAPVVISSLINEDELELYIVSDKLEDLNGTLTVSAIHFIGDTIDSSTKEVTVKANASNLVFSRSISQLIQDADRNQMALSVSFNMNNREVTKNIFYLAKPKDMQLPEAVLNTEIIKEGNDWILEIRTDKIARDVHLNVPNSNIFFTDNYFDLLPGETKRIYIQNVKGETIEKSEIKINMLNNY